MERNPCETKESGREFLCFTDGRDTVFFLWEEGLTGRAEGEGPADQASGKVGKGLDPMAGLGSWGGPGNPPPPENGARIGLLVFENI